MITAALLALFTLACLAMGGIRSWSDETQLERNALVFQGRNQTYGAYPLRRDYGHRLLLAITATFGLMALAITLAKLAFTGPSIAPPPTTGTVVDVDLERTYVVPLAPKPRPASGAAAPPKRKAQVEERPVEAVDSMVPPKAPLKDTAQYALGQGTSSSGAAIGTGGGQAGSPQGTGLLAGIDSVWSGVDLQELPAFPGGEAALQAWMQDNLLLPSGPPGRETVFVQFTVMQDGAVRQVQAVKGKTNALKEAAERAVRHMPPWSPGRMNGHPVRCRLILPIHCETR